jgi:excisionase family DNA binding protein
MTTTPTNAPATGRGDPSDPAGDRQTFELYGRRFTHTNSPDVQQLLAAAHTERVRPLCLCRPDGVAMYVAKIGPEKYVIKRMPDTGLAHTHRCASYLPPEELSGLGQVLGSAITEEADSGLIAIKLGFRMSKAERAAPAGVGSGGVADSVAADPNRLTLRAVLHYLWQEADLATWSPGMAGKRNWRIVSWYLRQAARGKFTKGKPLATRLYVPEPFNAEKKTEIAARRLSAWAPMQQHGPSQQFMMLIGELKAIEPARFGHKLVIKHLPDAPLMVDDTLLNLLNKRFGDELELWQSDDEGHLMVIATFSIGRAGLATAEEISLVMTDRNCCPTNPWPTSCSSTPHWMHTDGSPSRCATTSHPTSPWPPWCSPTPRPQQRPSCYTATRTATPPPRSRPTPTRPSGPGSSATTCPRFHRAPPTLEPELARARPAVLLNRLKPASGSIRVGHTRSKRVRRSGRVDIAVSEPWVSAEVIATHLGVTKDTVYAWIADKAMPAHKVGRLWKFQTSEVDEWVRSGGAAVVDEPPPTG